MDPQTGVTPWYLDKALYVTVLGFLAPLIAQKFGVEVNSTEIASLAVTIVAFVVSHKWKTTQIVTENIRASASKAQGLTEAKAADSDAASALAGAGK